MVERVKWPQDWNRPLSQEELAIARRLDRVPDELVPRSYTPLRPYFEQELDSALGGGDQGGGGKEVAPGEVEEIVSAQSGAVAEVQGEKEIA